MNLLHSAPMPGDAVRLDGYLCGAKRGAIGVIGGAIGRISDQNDVCFAFSAFRSDRYVSCSGGPVPCVGIGELVATSETEVVSFWHWKDGIPGGGRGVDYTLEVPLWSWEPRSMRAKVDKALQTYRFWRDDGSIYVRDAQLAAVVLGYTVIERPMPKVRNLIKANVPETIKDFVIWLCYAGHIGGTTDPMYISNLVAEESNRGDGGGWFFSQYPAASDEDIDRILNRLLSAYQTCLCGKVSPALIRDKLVAALV